ncbi:GIY-YIG nuclease family protein [Endozoicomonas sp. SCSIO W0465]|uniref:GIY-YIG nuclease family protein n=1 Tax=Endozoicomonas sp. SCSIO W0465 TaxID=2918516 RepID=UPI0020758BD1|nr:GIY-YIG nuclease family protein [Endozoicomonas sp. SCSIO W0465]USE35155.1 GIY-YIG nuclease family protein [Endozoicomonas sp. SCSIO W0465]
MIIFTVTNKTTSQVYVGSTRNDLVDQWEKMVAAAEQNLDYPLYQEIRVHGRDGFVVEEWDFVDDRNELNTLEQEAIETLDARSLRGYKTSTVKIQPKKKTRARKSNFEKELASIFTDFDGDMDDFDEISPEPKKQTEEKTAAPQQPIPAKLLTEATTDRTRPSETNRDISATQENTAEPQKEKRAAKPENGSQVNAVVQMNHICLSDDISVQLEAIQAAANAVLSGDNNAVELLNSKPAAPAAVEAVEQPEPVKAAKPEIIIEPRL